MQKEVQEDGVGAMLRAFKISHRILRGRGMARVHLPCLGVAVLTCEVKPRKMQKYEQPAL